MFFSRKWNYLLGGPVYPNTLGNIDHGGANDSIGHVSITANGLSAGWAVVLRRQHVRAEVVTFTRSSRNARQAYIEFLIALLISQLRALDGNAGCE